MEFLNKVKKDLQPDLTVIKQVNDFVTLINKEIKKNKIKAICVKGGSVAKSTFLKDDYDVDLFVKFDYSYKNQNISDKLAKILKKFNPELVHGSRDYFHIKDKLNYEVVPVLNVKNPELAKNVTDMSPLHVDWVNKNIKKGQDDEIRLTKKFCKVIKVYGAESYINGFSGHVVDILIIKYGSFLNLLKESQKWKPQIVIDIESYYENKRDVLFNMNQSKILGPLIIIDPILKTRNAASALSYEKFAIFKKKAKEFLKKPFEIYFKEEKIGITSLRKKYKKNLYILTLKAKSGKKDVVGSKILKAYKFVKNELQKAGFNFKSGWTWNDKYRVLFWFVFKNLELPATRVIEGPPSDMKDHVKIFKKKYKKCYVKKEKLFAKVKIKHRTVNENIKEIVKKDYFKEKIKFVKTEKYI